MNGRERSASVWAEKAEHDLSAGFAALDAASAPCRPWHLAMAGSRCHCHPALLDSRKGSFLSIRAPTKRAQSHRCRIQS